MLFAKVVYYSNWFWNAGCSYFC